MTDKQNEPKQTPREIMDVLYAMPPAEVSRFLGDHFQRMCSKPLPSGDDQ